MFSLKTQFDKLLDKATSNLRLETDWPTIIKICDMIRQNDVQPKYVLGQIKKKLVHTNPHVALFALQVLESCVKNCGSLIHEEIGSKAYMEQLREVVKTTPHAQVKNKILELLQAWAYAFRNSMKYRIIQDTVNVMKTEGYKFPAMKESDAMFSADTAPEWADGLCCHRCRVQFTVMQRKHHCRACGQVFCNQCSAKSCTLPRFGIEKEVRVCDTCHEKHSKPLSSTPPSGGVKTEELPIEYLTSSLAQQSQVTTNQAPPARKSEEELREEEELQLALALSQSEAESKNHTHKSVSVRSTSPASTMTRNKTYSPPPQLSCSPEDPELAKYLNRSHWEKQSEASNTPSAPIYATVNKVSSTPFLQENEVNESKVESEMDDFVYKLRCQLEIFVNRMKSNSSRGRSIANDSSVQTLFLNITTMHSQLIQYVNKQDDKRVYYEGLQDKLTQVRDARAALDALREEHREQMRREAEAAERLRQIQMAQKLEIMRKKKQEYLQYQRQLALQRIQEQEREMQLRQEQQKQQNLRGYSTLPYYPPGGGGGFDPAVSMPQYGNAGVYPPPPYHGGPMMSHDFMMSGGNMDQIQSGHMISPPAMPHSGGGPIPGPGHQGVGTLPGHPPGQMPLGPGHPPPTPSQIPPQVGQIQPVTPGGQLPPANPQLPPGVQLPPGQLPPHMGPQPPHMVPGMNPQGMPPHMGQHMPMPHMGMVPPQMQPSPNHQFPPYQPQPPQPPQQENKEQSTGELISFD